MLPALQTATPSPLKARSRNPALSLCAPHTPFSICGSNLLPKPPERGCFWGGLSCLVGFLGDLGLGAQTANLLEERKRWVGVGQGRGAHAGEIGPIC